MGYIKIISCSILVFLGAQAMKCERYKDPSVPDAVIGVAKDTLQFALENSSKWEKVHAAEYILNLQYANNVFDVFVEEEKRNRHEPYYRIGLWRVLSRAAKTNEEKNKWLDSISRVFGKQGALDRIHAAEALAKLEVSPKTISVKVTDSILGDVHNPMWAYTYWGTAYTSAKDMCQVKNNFVDLVLNSNESILIKRIALYALYKMKNVGVQNWDLLTSRVLDEPRNSPLYTSYLICTLANSPKDSLFSPRFFECRRMMEEQIQSLQEDQLAAALGVYEEIATAEDIPFLTSFLDKGADQHNVETIMAAANALLNIDREGR